MVSNAAQDFDFLNPDYGPAVKERVAILQRLRSDQNVIRPRGFLPAMLTYYRNPSAESICDFIERWCWTYDPRNIAKGRQANVPFLLFERQRQYVTWLWERYTTQSDGLTEKSRDSGATYLAGAFSLYMWLFVPGAKFSFGSRKEALVDKLGDPDSIFEKIRMMLDRLPKELKPGAFELHYLRLINITNNAFITGESGDNIGRGGRSLMYFKDESAFYPRPDKIDAALSQNADIKIDISTPNGNGNPFFVKRHGGKLPVFTFHWKEDPRKDVAWYEKQCRENPPHIIAQEIDISYEASIEDICIPGMWVRAAVGFKIKPSGSKRVGFDVADEGGDANAAALVQGVVLLGLKEWLKGTTTESSRKIWALADAVNADSISYDSIGVGAGAKGEFKSIQETLRRKLEDEGLSEAEIKELLYNPTVFGFNAGSKKLPGFYCKGKRNADMFANLKAKAMWGLRCRFEKVYEVVNGIAEYPESELISIQVRDIDTRNKLITELSTPKYFTDGAGKIIIESKKQLSTRGIKSPNLLEAVMIAYNQPHSILDLV